MLVLINTNGPGKVVPHLFSKNFHRNFHFLNEIKIFEKNWWDMYLVVLKKNLFTFSKGAG